MEKYGGGHTDAEPQTFQVDTYDGLADQVKKLLQDPRNQVTSLCTWTNGTKLQRMGLGNFTSFWGHPKTGLTLPIDRQIYVNALRTAIQLPAPILHSIWIGD